MKVRVIIICQNLLPSCTQQSDNLDQLALTEPSAERKPVWVSQPRSCKNHGGIIIGYVTDVCDARAQMARKQVVLKGTKEVTWIHNRDCVKAQNDIYKGGGLQVEMMDGANQYL